MTSNENEMELVAGTVKGLRPVMRVAVNALLQEYGAELDAENVLYFGCATDGVYVTHNGSVYKVMSVEHQELVSGQQPSVVEMFVRVHYALRRKSER